MRMQVIKCRYKILKKVSEVVVECVCDWRFILRISQGSEVRGSRAAFPFNKKREIFKNGLFAKEAYVPRVSHQNVFVSRTM